MLNMRSLDPDDPRPPYAQLVDAIRDEIERGALKPGQKLPKHQELVAQYGVSLGTVKRALGVLQGSGLIVSRQGQGAQVRTHPRERLPEGELRSIVADLVRRVEALERRVGSE
jgi:DNA-binding GntR family transcriptional regulator